MPSHSGSARFGWLATRFGHPRRIHGLIIALFIARAAIKSVLNVLIHHAGLRTPLRYLSRLFGEERGPALHSFGSGRCGNCPARRSAEYFQNAQLLPAGLLTPPSSHSRDKPSQWQLGPDGTEQSLQSKHSVRSTSVATVSVVETLTKLRSRKTPAQAFSHVDQISPIQPKTAGNIAMRQSSATKPRTDAFSPI